MESGFGIDGERIARCALNRIFGYGPRLGSLLIESVGSALRVFSMTREELRGIIGPDSKHLERVNSKEFDESGKELERLYSQGCRFIYKGEYPSLLAECEDAPIGLYLRCGSGLEHVLGYKYAVAIVGTRDMTSYGKDCTVRLLSSLAESPQKPVIVSGLAFGVDAVAHSCALEMGLPTIAVLPTCVDTVYPFRHRELAERIERTPGCALLSDYPPGTVPKAINFLRRNRIIAGLGHATVLVESKAKGGGMITARFAASYQREVYAIPGRTDDPMSRGCNILISSNVAEALSDCWELPGKLGLGTVRKPRKQSAEETVAALYSGKEDPEVRAALVELLGFIGKGRDLPMEELCRSSGLSFGDVSIYVAMLESDGLIRRDILGRCNAV